MEVGLGSCRLDDMFAIDFDETDGILRSRLDDFWTREVMDEFSKLMAAKVAEIRSRRDLFGVLSAARTFAVQSMEVGLEFEAMMGRAATLHRSYRHCRRERASQDAGRASPGIPSPASVFGRCRC